jgi:AraC-like DNA-binding protein
MKITFDPFCTPLNFVGKTAAFFYSSHITPLHSHNTLQLIFDLKGTFIFRTEHTNWERYAGIIIKENIAHQLNTNQGLQFIIYIDSSSAAAQKLKDKYLNHKDFCDVSVTFSPLEEALIYKNLVKSEKKSIELLIQLIFSRMIDVSFTENSERITQVLRLIKQIPPADLSIHRLASGIFISESRLRMHFKQLMGVSLHQYIIKHKLLLAITSIINGASIQDAAYDSGFTDSSHLNKVMVKTFGINPSMFLRKSQTFFVIPDNNSFKLETQIAL